MDLILPAHISVVQFHNALSYKSGIIFWYMQEIDLSVYICHFGFESYMVKAWRQIGMQHTTQDRTL